MCGPPSEYESRAPTKEEIALNTLNIIKEVIDGDFSSQPIHYEYIHDKNKDVIGMRYTRMDGAQLVPFGFKTPMDAEQFIKWMEPNYLPSWGISWHRFYPWIIDVFTSNARDD